MTEKLRIIFMGTPTFAVPSLELLQMYGYDIVAVVTAPDKPAGRGLNVRYSPVKECAIRLGIPVFQPVKLQDPEFIARMTELKADLGVVVAFRMLPEQVWTLPRLGCINLHASLLPQYRGAAPINHAIINGEKETGVTTFFIRKEMDTGNIIFSERIAIGENETAGELHDRMMVAGAELLVKTVQSIQDNSYTPIEQNTLPFNESELKKAPKIFPEQCRINWNQPVEKIHNFIRGLSPHPGAFTDFVSPEGKEYFIKIYRSEKLSRYQSSVPGEIESDTNELKISGSDSAVKIIELQLSGKKILHVKEFLRGFRMDNIWIAK